MTGMMLALAGLTCGDAGPGMGVATAPVAVSVSFDGVWDVLDHKEPSRRRMALFRGVLWRRGLGISPGMFWKMEAKSGGVLEVWDGQRFLRGEWRLGREGILITIKKPIFVGEEDISWTLRPRNP
jgi:hypothetical protein